MSGANPHLAIPHPSPVQQPMYSVRHVHTRYPNPPTSSSPKSLEMPTKHLPQTLTPPTKTSPKPTTTQEPKNTQPSPYARSLSTKSRPCQ